MVKALAQKTKLGMVWNAANILVTKFFRLISGIILARILFPDDFGLYGLALIIIRFSRKLTNLGFASVIVQKKDLEKGEIDTIFTTSLGINLTVSLGLYFVAPLFAHWIDEPRVTDVVRVISITFLMAAFSLVAGNILKREMRFKELNIGRAVRSAFNLPVAIILALLNYGAWSLILGEVFGTFASMIVILVYARWVPKISFKIKIFKKVYGYGMRVSFISYLNYFINNIDYLLISKSLGLGALGYYERAFNLMNFTRKQLGRTLNETLFSAYSKISDDRERIIKNFSKILNYVSLFAYPILIWLYFAAPSLVINLYGPRWAPIVLPLQIMSISGLLKTLLMVFFPVTLALDLTADRLKAQVVYLLALTLFIYAMLPFNIIGVAWAVVAATIIYGLLMLWIMRKNLNYSITDFFSSQKTALIYGTIQALVLVLATQSMLHFYPMDSIFMFGVVSGISLLTFTLTHLVFRKDDYQNLINEFKTIITRKTRKKIKQST